MKAKTIIMTTLATVVLAACSNDENNVINSGPSKATFTATIAGQVNTRVYDQTWNEGDLIGVSGMSGGVPYTNVQYETINGDGNFTISNPGNEIYFQDGNTVTFTAYYPWNEFTQDSPVIIADTRTQASQNTFDFLWSQQTGSKINPHVSFTFAHKMAKLVLTIKGGTDVSYYEVQRAVLSLRGFKNNGSFNVTNGTAAATDDDLTTDWTFAGNTTETGYNAPSTKDEAKGTVAYTLILFPQEFSAPLPITATLTGSQSFSATLDFTTANSNAGDTEARNEWVAGRQYNLSVTLNKTGFAVDGCTIQEWDEADCGNVDAD